MHALFLVYRGLQIEIDLKHPNLDDPKEKAGDQAAEKVIMFIVWFFVFGWWFIPLLIFCLILFLPIWIFALICALIVSSHVRAKLDREEKAKLRQIEEKYQDRLGMA